MIVQVHKKTPVGVNMKDPSQDSLNCFEGLDLFSFVFPMSGLKSFVIFDIWGRRGGIKKIP